MSKWQQLERQRKRFFSLIRAYFPLWAERNQQVPTEEAPHPSSGILSTDHGGLISPQNGRSVNLRQETQTDDLDNRRKLRRVGRGLEQSL
ncbi:uncharacterized protein PgNI_00035 [Pyricularia grisea]|uniref:Uncharacterized protein n=1 Tax=Pyricularia grisea TaxID=148305 RepID=A0A6P8BHJ3_PYRGI|nr:uncharacterized protein PgNI_00035 [Pyricularia grisea]TLD16079.1 hypothetical protein PgNI_00035 [Pyricularia grisea]